jgi:hypothetical protein
LGFRVNARTVLELGSELISSDIIAFYELIKNAFDAGSTTGAVISFDIVLRRNAYLKLRKRALQHIEEVGKDRKLAKELLEGMKRDVARGAWRPRRRKPPRLP